MLVAHVHWSPSSSVTVTLWQGSPPPPVGLLLCYFQKSRGHGVWGGCWQEALPRHHSLDSNPQDAERPHPGLEHKLNPLEKPDPVTVGLEHFLEGGPCSLIL